MVAKELFSLSAYKYDLPEELIAKYPCEPRDSSRLMIINRQSGEISETRFRYLQDFLQRGDSIILNNTKVVPARFIGRRRSGGEAEVFLTRRHQDGSWDALVRPGRKLPPGSIVTFNSSFSCEILEVLANGERRVRFHALGDLDQMLESCGQIPLPHYMKREPTEEDKKNYQTIYAAHPGALAAPTAGLHFTSEMFEALDVKGVSQIKITLHTGLGTFRPVQTEDIRAHLMHDERYQISDEAAVHLNNSLGKTQICVGTTCCRALETSASPEGIIQPGEFDTRIFIYPGYQFKYVKSLLTNFHLPGSTLLMLVSAFAGYELIMEAYRKAVKERYRFFSYGDAMLIL